jgi:hypothetical protein
MVGDHNRPLGLILEWKMMYHVLAPNRSYIGPHYSPIQAIERRKCHWADRTSLSIIATCPVDSLNDMMAQPSRPQVTFSPHISQKELLPTGIVYNIVLWMYRYMHYTCRRLTTSSVCIDNASKRGNGFVMLPCAVKEDLSHSSYFSKVF